MINKLLLLSLIWIAGCTTPSSQQAAREAGSSPNIILVFVDDLGYGDLGCYGQKKIATPNLDRMAAEGMRFTQFYAGAPVCAPSRHSLLTGLHTGHTAVRSNINYLPLGQYPLPDSAVTMGEMLKQQGYSCAAIGKWGMGAPNNSGDPLQQGFAYFYGYYCQGMAHNYYPTHLWRNHDSVLLPNEVRPVKVNYMSYPLSYATKKVEYSANHLFEEALNFVEEKKDEGPFFLYYAPTLPHSNGEAPEDDRFEVPDWGQYADSAWTPMEKGYASMVSMLDQQMGQLMAKLKEDGLADNTLLLFTSDNGPTKFAAIFESSGTLRGRKRDLYEGGIRVPLIAWWPGRIGAGTLQESPATTYDLFATFADLSHAETSASTDGISMVSALMGEQSSAEEVLYWEFYEGDRSPKQAIRQGDWKLIRFFFDEPSRASVELYDLSTDLAETTNLAEAHPDLVDSLILRMEEAHEPYLNRNLR